MSKVMLYKYPGKHKIHGGMFDYDVVSDENVDASLANGWFKTTPEAKDANKAPEPSDRDLLLAKAKELGLEHPKNIKTKKLIALIESAEE